MKKIDIEVLAERVLVYLSQLPDKTELSTYEAVKHVYASLSDLPVVEAIEFEDWFEIHSKIRRKADRCGLVLDDSAYENMDVGLFYHIPYVVTHK